MRRILTLLTLLSILVGCENNESDILSNVDSYPMAVGTEWVYERQIIIETYESETSNNVIDIDTIYNSVKVWIEKDTILNDTMSVTMFQSEVNDDNWIMMSSQFKYLDNEGLKNYAYLNDGSLVFPKNSSLIKYGLFTDFYKTGYNELLPVNSMIYEENPTLDIQLPLTEKSSWTYRKPTETRVLQIDKSVTGVETLSITGESFPCFIVSLEYLNDPDFEGIEFTDWISNKGLIKREIIVDRTTPRYWNGEPVHGTQKTTDILTLKSLTIR